MAWYWIVLIVIAVIFALLFVCFITNGDGKMIEQVYDLLTKYHNNKEKHERI